MLLRPCLVLTTFLLGATCVAYPAAVTAAARAFFPAQARGSLITEGGRVRGSSLLGQTLAHPAEHPEYVWGRPSATSVDAATGLTVSSGSNLGPSNPALHDQVRERVAELRATGVTGPVPVDLVTSSGSGLDPHLSPAAVEVQVPRVARARQLSEEEVRSIVRAHTEGRALGVVGEPRVNVLALN
ncbi:MAG: potassium-transporting ATPase subunit KdpC, partial [Myxococcales bacterium]